MIFDGHKSHIQYRVSSLAIKNNVHILSLPAHSSDKIQPLDVGVFAPVKKVWLQIKRNYAHKTSFKTITKEDFPSLMKQLREQGAFKELNIIAGFKSSGIWPVNLEVALSKLPPQVVAPLNQPIPMTSSEQSPHNQTLLPTTPASEGQLSLGPPGTPAIEEQLPVGLPGTPVIEKELPVILPAEEDQIQAADNQPQLATTSGIGQRECPSTPSARSMHHLPNTPTFSDLASFRKLLLQAVAPRQERDKLKRKKLSFNNMVLTQDDVMKQLEDEEKRIEINEQNKKERKRKREESKKEKEAEKEKKKKETMKKRKKLSSKKKVEQTSSEEEDLDFISDQSDEDLAQFLIEESDSETGFNINKPSTSGTNQRQLNTAKFSPKKGEHVAAIYDNHWFIAKVVGTSVFDNTPEPTTYYHLEFAECNNK